jgi:cyclic pyranopterin monophosphate synthase
VHAVKRAEKRGDPGILTRAVDALTSRSPMPSSDPRRIVEEPPSAPPAPPPQLSTHIGPTGDVRMVDVADKPPTKRAAVATSRVRMREETIERLLRGDTPKGEVLATARIAGIMAAKRTPDIIPMCHGIALSHVEVQIQIDKPSCTVLITARAEAVDRTGVEMEAMVAASIAALTMYDMLKGIDREMVVEQVMLVEKSGGRSGHFRRST